MSSLNSGQIAGFTSKQLDAMSLDQIMAVTVRDLTTGQISGATSTVVDAFTPT